MQLYKLTAIKMYFLYVWFLLLNLFGNVTETRALFSQSVEMSVVLDKTTILCKYNFCGYIHMGCAYTVQLTTDAASTT